MAQLKRSKKNKLTSIRAFKKILKIISQKEIADELHLYESAVSRWHTNGVARDKAQHLQKFSASKGVDVSIYELWPELKELIEDH